MATHCPTNVAVAALSAANVCAEGQISEPVSQRLVEVTISMAGLVQIVFVN